MGKKKKETTGYKQDQSIKDKRKYFMQTTIMEAIILGVLGFYLVAVVVSYHIMHPSQGIVSQFGDAFEAVKNNPLYPIAAIIERPEGFLPVFGGGLMAVALLELLVLINYYFNRSRIHNDLDTLKGSTIWANAKDICAKYADAEEDD